MRGRGATARRHAQGAPRSCCPRCAPRGIGTWAPSRPRTRRSKCGCATRSRCGAACLLTCPRAGRPLAAAAQACAWEAYEAVTRSRAGRRAAAADRRAGDGDPQRGREEGAERGSGTDRAPVGPRAAGRRAACANARARARAARVMRSWGSRARTPRRRRACARSARATAGASTLRRSSPQLLLLRQVPLVRPPLCSFACVGHEGVCARQARRLRPTWRLRRLR